MLAFRAPRKAAAAPAAARALERRELIEGDGGVVDVLDPPPSMGLGLKDSSCTIHSRLRCGPPPLGL
jgi:hypothetical protein